MLLNELLLGAWLIVKGFSIQRITRLVLRAVAVGMSVASIVMGFIPGVADVNTHITLFSVGLAALAVAAL